MKLGVAPEAVLAAYRVGDSPPNVITPLMPYFALFIAWELLGIPFGPG